MILFYKNPAFWQFIKCSVIDEYKNVRYTVEHTFYGKDPAFPLAKRFHDVSIKNMGGAEVVRLERSIKNVLRFHIWVGDEKLSSVERHKEGFHLHYDYFGLGWKLTVDPFKLRYIIQKGETLIATVQYRGNIGRAGYEMDIPDPADAELVLAAVVAMHIIEEKASQRHHHHHHHHHHRH